MTPLPEPVRGIRRLGFDTAPVIYFVEAHPEYDAQITPISERIRQGELEGFTSVITLLEVLVSAYAIDFRHAQPCTLGGNHRGLLTQNSASVGADLCICPLFSC